MYDHFKPTKTLNYFIPYYFNFLYMYSDNKHHHDSNPQYFDIIFFHNHCVFNRILCATILTVDINCNLEPKAL